MDREKSIFTLMYEKCMIERKLCKISYIATKRGNYNLL